jgi:hypothetical protein
LRRKNRHVAQKEVRDEKFYEGRISGFELGSHIWPPGAPLSGVGKFGEFIQGIVEKCFSLITS